jgi:hypothetical protein
MGGIFYWASIRRPALRCFSRAHVHVKIALVLNGFAASVSEPLFE